MSKDIRQTPFYMVQIWLDPRNLMELGRMLRLPLDRVDNHYLVHCALNELFQDQAPVPFSVEESQRIISGYKKSNGKRIPVLCYSDLNSQSLQRIAKGFTTPTVYNICDWERMQSKPMPEEFTEGMRLGFELRACPVVRKANNGPSWKQGQEMDAFLSRVLEVNDPDTKVEREQVYSDWFKNILSKNKGAKPISVNMKRFSLERMARRTQEKNRKVKVIKRPDVTLAGKLEVTDGPEFIKLLKEGLGRHKSFGFGMLKIKRA